MVLLDTCTLLWLVADQSKLSDRARTVLCMKDELLYVSAISAFEVGIKHREGAIVLPKEPDVWYAEAIAFHGVSEIPVSGTIAARSTMLPALHSDPCDRIIIATAQLQSLTILTPDRHIRDYPETSTDW